MLNINDSLILAVDFQEKLISATSADNELINASKMVEVGKILDIPVVISEQYPKGLGETSCKLINKIPPSSVVLEKTTFSLLKTEKIYNAIKAQNRKQIILFGIETHICVLQTALDLIDDGFEVYLIKNASKSRKESEHEAGINYMQNMGVKILTLEIALFELLKSSTHPNFKEIQALIK